MTDKQKNDSKINWQLCLTLAQRCDANPETIVDLLTGYLWDEEEAGEMKTNQEK